MNELVSVPISPWYTIPAAVGLLALTFVFVPGVLLHLGVLIYPKGHARRQEFTAELYAVPFIKRPFWVVGMLVRCLFEGAPYRFRSIRLRRTSRGHRAVESPVFSVTLPRPSSPQFFEMVDALEDIPCMQGEHSRTLLIDQLKFAGTIRYFPARRPHITSILRTSFDYPEGVLELVRAISNLESTDSVPLKRLLSLLTGGAL